MSDITSQPDFSSDVPPWPPVVPPTVAPPAPPSLGFFGALAWCVVFILFTQFPGAFVAVAVVIVLSAVAPRLLPKESLNSVQDLMSTPGGNIALASAMGVTQLLVIGFSWLVIRLLIGPDWRRQLNLRLPNSRHFWLALVSLPALWLMGNVSYTLLQQILPSMQKMFPGYGVDEITELFAGWPWPVAVLIIGVGPGIGEELWCRGFLGRGLVLRYGAVVGVVFTSFFFGLIHLDPPQGGMAMLLGLWLHYVYLTTRSLYVPMLLHFLNNTLSVLVPRWLDAREMTVVEGTSGPLSWGITALALGWLFLVGWGLYRTRARGIAT